MTSILSQLNSLTKKDKNGLLPCYCGHEGSLQHVEDYSCYAVICSRENHHETQWYETSGEAIHEWNNRPREGAFASLVREAITYSAPKLTANEAMDKAFKAANPLIAVIADSGLPADTVRNAVRRAVSCALNAVGTRFEDGA